MNFEKKNNIYRVVMIIIVTVIITFITTSVLIYNHFKTTEIAKPTTDLESKMQIIKSYLYQYYLGDIKEDDMSEYALKGYVAGLGDEYTEYLTKSEYEELMVDVNGNYIGIGVYITQDKNGNTVVLTPIKNSPAEEAGIKSGDIIIKVNDEDIKDLDLELVSNKIKGEEGSSVNIQIQRDNDEIINKTIVREKVEINQIESKVIDNNIGYIQILSFDGGSANKFETILDDLMEKGIKSLIIDVRDNGGGIVTEAIDIADLLLPKDKTVMIEVDKEKKEEITKSENNSKINSEIQVILLTNENSASASEILIGALKDNNRAKTIGTKTFGKGVMQEVIQLPTGGALKVTIKEFLTPNREKINEEGINPDIEVEEIENNDTDEQLQKAIQVLSNE